MCVLLEKKIISVGYLLSASNMNIIFRVYRCQGNTKWHGKYINAIFADSFISDLLIMSNNLSRRTI